MDEIDEAQASHYAWKILAKGDPLPVLRPITRAEQQQMAARARARCAPFAIRIEALWDLPSDAQAAAMPELADHLRRIGRDVGALEPRAAVRLARLFTRHGSALDPADEDVLILLGHCRYGDPDAFELFVETAAAGHLRMTHVLHDLLESGAPDTAWEGFAARFGPLIDPARAPASSVCAVRWLRWCDVEEARPLIARALRLPHVPTRAAALEVGMATGALDPADVRWLLDDALVHPVNRAHERYAELLCAAVCELRPEGGDGPLRHLYASAGLYMNFDDEPFGQRFALEALTGAYPRVALPLVDRLLESSRHGERFRGALAAARLPDAEARPRLAAAMGDVSEHVRWAARNGWDPRFGPPPDVDPLAGLAPRDPARAQARIARLRAGGEDAVAVVRELLADPTDPDALDLLLLALRAPVVGEGLPQRHEWALWMRRIVDAFGPACVDRLVCWCADDPNDLWRRGLGSVELDEAEEAILAEAVRGHLRAAIESGDEARAHRLAGCLRAPCTDEVVSAWALPLLLDASMPLRVWNDLSERIGPTAVAVEGLRRALNEVSPSDEDRVRRLVWLACRWVDDSLIEPIEALVEGLAGQTRIPSWASAANRFLDERGRRGPAWRRAALSDPSRAAFSLAAVPNGEELGELLPLFEAALSSSARDGASALEAATVLLAAGRLGVEDDRLEGIVARAPEEVRGTFLLIAVYAPVRWLPWMQAQLVELVGSPDPEVARGAASIVGGAPLPDREEVMRACVERWPSFRERGDFLRHLGLPPEAYWLPDGDVDGDLRLWEGLALARLLNSEVP